MTARWFRLLRCSRLVASVVALAPVKPALKPKLEEQGGGGGGGGGTSRSRPVAVIEIGPEGVHVRSVVDWTAIALAAVTAWGAMLLALGRMHKARRH